MFNDNLKFYEKKKLSGGVSVLGVPIDLGKDNSGTDLGPKYIRKAGLKEMCVEVGLAYNDLGDVKCADRKSAKIGNPKAKYLEEIVRVGEETAKIVNKEVSSGNKMLVLGGDHSLAVGSISGASAACNGDLGVIWIDAHGDMMTDKNTLSGNVHGMPSAAVMGFGHPDLVNILHPGSKIKPENIIYIGLKDLDQGEIDLIREKKLTVFTIMDMLEKGWKDVFAGIVDLQKKVGNIWVSLDLDSIDKEYAPAILMPNSGGLTQREVLNLTRFIGKTCKVVGMDIVELAPKLDIKEKTSQLAVELAANLLGSEYGWYTQYMKKETEKQKGRK